MKAISNEIFASIEKNGRPRAVYLKSNKVGHYPSDGVICKQMSDANLVGIYNINCSPHMIQEDLEWMASRKDALAA